MIYDTLLEAEDAQAYFKKKQLKKAKKVIKGLLEIAKIAMPDTYATDRRVKKAKKFLREQ